MNIPPSSSAEWAELGEHYLVARRVAEAAECYQRAAELEPTAWGLWARLAKLQMSIRQFDGAETALANAASLHPDDPELQTLRAYVLREQNEPDAALASCNRALAIDPDNLHAAIAEALMLPPVYSSRHDLDRWRERFDAGLRRLHDGLPHWRRSARRILDLEWSNFLLAYQGENDIELQKGYSAFVDALLGACVPELQASIEQTQDRGPKIRVGFVSADLRQSTVGDYFAHWISDLPRDSFHITSFYTGTLVDDRTRTIERHSDDFVQVTGAADRVATVVRDRALDIAVLLDVGMSAKSVLLANLRIARLQCAAWGHPVTTGSRFVEYFISCDAMEPIDAESHYSESLLRLPGIGVRYRPPAAPADRGRDAFGLPPDRHVYLCPQSLCKIHPDNDPFFIELVARDPDALIVFFRAQSSGQTKAFAQRLEQALRARNVPPRKQFTFLPRMSREGFLAVMRVSDVMIDTLRWSGGNTTLDALSSALPVVTVEGRFMRGRQTAAMLRIVGVDGLIARDAEHSIAIAIKVASDSDYRAALSTRIRDGLPKLFDRAEPVTALATELERVGREVHGGG